MRLSYCLSVSTECVYVNMCGGYMEEAVFGLRLKCRTRVPLQERSPAEQRQGDFFSSLGETRDTIRITQIYSQLIFPLLFERQTHCCGLMAKEQTYK